MGAGGLWQGAQPFVGKAEVGKHAEGEPFSAQCSLERPLSSTLSKRAARNDRVSIIFTSGANRITMSRKGLKKIGFKNFIESRNDNTLSSSNGRRDLRTHFQFIFHLSSYQIPRFPSTCVRCFVCFVLGPCTKTGSKTYVTHQTCHTRGWELR